MNNSNDASEIFYNFDVSIHHSKHQILINDLPIRETDNGSTTAIIPLQGYLQTGENTIEIRFTSVDSDGFDAASEFEFKITEENATGSKVIFQKENTKLPPGKQSENYGPVKFSVTSPMASFLFHDDQVIDLTKPDIQKRFMAEFNKIWHMFEKKDKAGLLALVAERQENYDEHTGLEKGTKLKRFSAMLDDVFGNPNNQFNSFQPETYKLFLYGHGKLVTYRDPKEYYQYIMYYDGEERSLVEVPIYLSMDKQGKIRVAY